MTALHSWNHVPGKRLQIGEEYAFVETMRHPNKVNPYKAEIIELDSVGEKVEMKLKITKTDPNKRYSIGQMISRSWHKEDANSGTTLIYNNYETGTNNYPNNTGIQFIQPE